ncbi:putative alpha beta-hydrolase [Lyophyllum shimeji]|uniref:Alpha beta-hydrolase n=1 Tax=Lyophyllum shimeji TaxID=47721 RepID=A0A9P3PSH4_LYOSH|nr:putative alpha beta-hydrolase [Lyophyllum shimeji]
MYVYVYVPPHPSPPLPAASSHVTLLAPAAIRTPAMLGIPYMAPLLRTPDGIDLSCYLLPQTRETLADTYHAPNRPIEDARVALTPAASDARATVVVFHGNSAHHWEDMVSARDLFEMKCNVFLLSYRGYSLSGGTPSEKGLRIDAQTALDYILNQPYLRQAPIILYGHSLGGAVAIDLASRNPSKVSPQSIPLPPSPDKTVFSIRVPGPPKISGLIVSNTFTSIPDIVRRWPYVGLFSFVCHQRWRSRAKMPCIPAKTPILMLSGRKDEVIPPELMDRLWAAAQKRGTKRRGVVRRCVDAAKTEDTTEVGHVDDTFITIEEGTHNDTPDFPEYWAAIRAYIQRTTHRAEDRPPPLETDPVPPPPPAQGVVDTRWRYVDRKLVVIEDTTEAARPAASHWS